VGDSDCIQLLAWALPQIGLRSGSFRRVKRQVFRRIRARIRELGLHDAPAYAEYLKREPGEWAELEAMCGITISRFYRDAAVFDCLAQQVLPALARRLAPGEPLRVWSAGCASGEEPYTIALIWELHIAASHPDRVLQVLGTDRNPQLLVRAANARYRHSSLRELPPNWIARSFSQDGDAWCLDPSLRGGVTFECQDLRRELPAGRFDMILCRNLAFSYFELEEQRKVLRALVERLNPGGHLAVGLREQLPDDAAGLQRLAECDLIYERTGTVLVAP